MDLTRVDSRGIVVSVRGAVNNVGTLAPWPENWLNFGVMGPFGFLPFMQCYHGILSATHSTSGFIDWKEGGGIPKQISLRGKGYLEKDWGQVFPSAYIWMQCNHFEIHQDASIIFAVAIVPLPIPTLGSVRGFFCGLYLGKGNWNRWATYMPGCKITTFNIDQGRGFSVAIETSERALNIDARMPSDVEELPRCGIPTRKGFVKELIESLNGTVAISWKIKGRAAGKGGLLFQDVGNFAGVELFKTQNF